MHLQLQLVHLQLQLVHLQLQLVHLQSLLSQVSSRRKGARRCLVSANGFQQGLTKGDIAGIVVAPVAVLALFVWW